MDFGDQEFKHHFSQKFSWTSVKTFATELVCPDGQTTHLQGQIRPEAGIPLFCRYIYAIGHHLFLVIQNFCLIFLPKNIVDVLKNLTIDLVRPYFIPPSLHLHFHVLQLTIFFGDPNFDITFFKSFCECRLRL